MTTLVTRTFLILVLDNTTRKVQISSCESKKLMRQTNTAQASEDKFLQTHLPAGGPFLVVAPAVVIML